MQQSNGFTAFSLVGSSCQIVTPRCLVAQLVEQQTVNLLVAGSIPAEAAKLHKNNNILGLSLICVAFNVKWA